MYRLLKGGQHSNSEILADKQLKDSLLENTDLLQEKGAKSQVANACSSLAEETNCELELCLYWHEDTMRIHHPLVLREIAGSEKGKNIFNSLNSATNISVFFYREQ